MRETVKKVLSSTFVTALATSLVLTGCSSDASKSSSGGETSEGNKKTVVTFWHGQTAEIDLENLKNAEKAFEEQEPNIDINLVYTESNEGSDQKLLTAIAGGNPPDIALFDRFKVGSWAAQGSLTDLSEKASEAEITQNTYYPFAWDEASYKGKLYAIPLGTDSRLLYYNKDHFKAAGLDPNNPPKTIEELEAAAKKLTVKDGNRFKQIGFIPWYSQGWLYSWGWSFGGDFFNEETGEVTANDPKIVEALQWMGDYAKKYNIEDIAAFTNSQGTDAMDPFITGQISMKVDGNWTVAAIQKFKPDLNYGVTPIPTPTGTDFTTWSGGMSLVIPKGAKNVDAAWRFLEFAGKEEGQYLWNKNAGMSVIDSVNEKFGYKNDPILGEFVKILPQSNNRPVIPEGQLLWNELATATENTTRGKGKAQENLEKVTENVNAALAKHKE